MCLCRKERLVLTSNVKTVYIPIVYDSYEREVQKGTWCDSQDLAIEKGKSMVQAVVDTYCVWCYVRIEQRIVPMYKKENENE